MHTNSNGLRKTIDMVRWSKVSPTLLVTIVYIVFFAAYFSRHQAGVSRLHEGAGDIPYDGTYFYEIAVHPTEVSDKLDFPAYRYQRIIFPLLVRIIGLGNPQLISWSMFIVVLTSISLGTYFLSLLLDKWNYSPWYATIYGLFIGQFVSLRFVTSEPLCYLFVLVAIWLYFKQRIGLAVLFFALSILTKELAILFWLGFIIMSIIEQKKREFLLLSMAVIPYIVLQISLKFWLGEFGFNGSETGIEWLPLAGYIKRGFEPEMALVPLLLIIPALLCIALFFHLWRSRNITALSLALLFNAILVIQMPMESTGEFRAMGRIAMGLVLAAVLGGAEAGISRVLNYGLLWIPLSFIYLPSLFLIP